MTILCLIGMPKLQLRFDRPNQPAGSTKKEDCVKSRLPRRKIVKLLDWSQVSLHYSTARLHSVRSAGSELTGLKHGDALVSGTRNTISWLYNYHCGGFNVYIFVDLVKCAVLTLLQEIQHYINDPYYYHNPDKQSLKFWIFAVTVTFKTAVNSVKRCSRF